MKKLLAFLVLAILLAGCATTSEENYISEKNLECKKLAEKENLEEVWDFGGAFFSPKENSCLYLRYDCQLVDLFSRKVLEICDEDNKGDFYKKIEQYKNS
ncbi:MAG: hypothetical protein ABIE14_01925 [Patescibacteria group bacterium]